MVKIELLFGGYVRLYLGCVTGVTCTEIYI